MTPEPKRGDLWTLAGGGGNLTSKPRPALIITSEVFSGLDFVTVLLVTTDQTEGFTRKFVARESPASLVRGWSASILFPGWSLPGVAAWPPLVGARHYRDWYECRGW